MNVKTTPPAVVEALELLTRSWNPPHQPSRLIGLEDAQGQFSSLPLPAGLHATQLNTAYLRGFDAPVLAACSAWTGCELRGSTIPMSLPGVHAESLQMRLRQTPDPAGWPALQAPKTAIWGHAGQVLSVAFSADGRWLASGGGDRSVRLWAVQAEGTARETARLSGHEGGVLSVAFSADGRWLASGGGDGSVRLWAVQAEGTARETVRLSGHERGVSSVAFSADGRWLASGGDDRSVRLWAVQAEGTARETARLSGHEDWVRSVAFSADGRWLASGGGDGTFRLWAAENDGQWYQQLLNWGDIQIIRPEAADAWQLRRGDGKPWQTMRNEAGDILPADPVLYRWLWFMDPRWGAVPAFEVPPAPRYRWLQWSEDFMQLTVSKAPHTPQELQDWMDDPMKAP